MDWKYKNVDKNKSGYDDSLYTLKNTYTKDKYINSDESTRVNMVEDIFNIYRERNIYPITYYDEQGIKDEILKCINKEINLETNIMNMHFNQGSSLCKFLFPRIHMIEAKKYKNNTMLERFHNDHLLKRAIDFSLRFRKNVTPSSILASLEMIGGNTPTNFKPMKAKALYEKYCPPNGIIYDFSSGFGGRMLGALSSKNNYTYIGVEPCVETYGNLNKLGTYIESVTGRTNSYVIHNKCSEDYLGELESIDFAFSSPPYFNLERYSDEPTQCYVKFPTLDEWLEGYVRPTIRNTYKMMKQDSTYAVNIADFNVNNKRFEFVDEWIRIAEEEGFTYKEQLTMPLKQRNGDGSKKKGKEGVFIFEK